MRPGRGANSETGPSKEAKIPLNQNRNNNRRRGRSNRGPGGGAQGNRIDSRARGNAPQMLEKYKKMAHDASLNGDRVQTEYYLQFADHYFRVIADNRSQKDDQPQQRGRQNERDQNDDGDDEETEDRRPQQSQRDQGSRDDRDDRDGGNDRGAEGRRGSEGESGSVSDDADENPFVRESKPRRPRPPKKAAEGKAQGLDPAILPPSIGNDDGEAAAERPRRRTRSIRTPSEDEAREAHG